MSSLFQAILTRCALRVLLGVLVAAGQSVAYAGETQRMPPGAFLRHPVRDIEELNRELRTDSLLATRYSRLLHLSPANVRATFAELHLTRLKRDMLLSVHYVHAHETIGSKVRRVRKGTPVFALPDGTPLLAKVCGNPLRTKDPRSLTVQPKRVEGVYTASAEASETTDIPDFDPSEPLSSPALPVASSTIAMRDAAPETERTPGGGDKLDIDEIPADTLGPIEAPLARTVTQAKSALAAWAGGGGALLGAVGALSGQGSGQPSRTTAIPRILPTVLPNNQTPDAPPITPEPGSVLLALALGSAFSAHTALRRRKKRQ